MGTPLVILITRIHLTVFVLYCRPEIGVLCPWVWEEQIVCAADFRVSGLFLVNHIKHLCELCNLDVHLLL